MFSPSILYRSTLSQFTVLTSLVISRTALLAGATANNISYESTVYSANVARGEKHQVQITYRLCTLLPPQNHATFSHRSSLACPPHSSRLDLHQHFSHCLRRFYARE